MSERESSWSARILLENVCRGKIMELRKYCRSDLAQMAELFYYTVHFVCGRDYTKKQLDAWAPGKIDEENWHRRYSCSYTLLAVDGDKILGFGNIDDSGYLDMLYVHKDHQRKGVAACICDALEKHCPAKEITVHASVTAKPFFAARGYRVVKEQTVMCRGVEMTNDVMVLTRMMR